MENNYFPLLSHAHFSPSDVFHKVLVNLSLSNNGIVIFLIPVRVWEYLEWANSVKSAHCAHSFPFGQIGFFVPNRLPFGHGIYIFEPEPAIGYV